MKTVKLLLSFFLIFGFACPKVQAFEIMKPLSYEEGIEFSNWLMSEKLDGVRGYWDGQQLFSKNGTPFHTPKAFTKNFPDFAIEGELWGGRQTFEETVGIVKKQKAHEGWFELKFAIFDVPKASGGFEIRLKKAADWFIQNPSDHAVVIAHHPVDSHAHLSRELKRIEALGGEGIILRRRGTVYTAGRSRDILKVKSYSDMEAVVMAHIAGHGRNQGRMGALLVELPGSLTQFKIGTGFSDNIRENPPHIGALITFKYYGYYKSGIPKFPSFVRVRDSF